MLFRTAANDRPYHLGTYPLEALAREYYEAILVAFILALFVRTFVFENFKIPSGSMEDNLLIGDHLVVFMLLFGGLG